MAARKLQTEIDRTLKKVSEGVELFESIYDKMQASTNQTQKEKLEADLKTQIKKLQRLRDQIKTWVASTDIKDKSQLVDNRKLIETQMEKFKACEKEMKTKAFSKEGLTQAAKLDPKAREREELIGWVSTHIGTLEQQVESAEAEIETLHGAGKKKKGSAASSRLDELENLNERRKWHLGRLEIVLRLLINGTLATDRVAALKEDISYFVESNTEEDFDEDEGIYDELNLDEEEEQFGVPNDEYGSIADSEVASEDVPPRTPARKQQHDEESVASSKDSPVLKKAATTLQSRRPTNDLPKPPPVPPPPNPNFAQQPMSSILKAGLPPTISRPPVQNPPLRYAAAVTSSNGAPATTAAAQEKAARSEHTLPPSPSLPPAPPSDLNPTSISVASSGSQEQAISPSVTHASVSVLSPMLSSAASAQPDSSVQDSPAISEAAESSVSGPQATSSPQRSGPTNARPPSLPIIVASSQDHESASTELKSAPRVNGSETLSQIAGGPSAMSDQSQHVISGAPSDSEISRQTQSQQPPYVAGAVSLGLGQDVPPTPSEQDPALTSESSSHQKTSIAPSTFPGSLQDLVVSFENVKQKAAQRMTNLDSVNKLLEGGYATMPQPVDSEKPKYYVPRHPYQTSPYYPQQPSPLLSSSGLFAQLDVETLFYVFYYLPGTYQQFLAAKELKKQSWRFHIKYLTWFQRHSEPQAITEEYEQGVYVYFDWEGSWCQRKKSDFRFEYRYLSED